MAEYQWCRVRLLGEHVWSPTPRPRDLRLRPVQEAREQAEKEQLASEEAVTGLTADGWEIVSVLPAHDEASTPVVVTRPGLEPLELRYESWQVFLQRRTDVSPPLTETTPSAADADVAPSLAPLAATPPEVIDLRDGAHAPAATAAGTAVDEPEQVLAPLMRLAARRWREVTAKTRARS